jgi:hypothetical protein
MRKSVPDKFRLRESITASLKSGLIFNDPKPESKRDSGAQHQAIARS